MEFFVQGVPQAQPRPRAKIIGGFKKSIHVYDPGTATPWRESIVLMWKAIAGNSYDCPVQVSMLFLFPLPKSEPKGVVSKSKDTKPDLDNLIKAVLDALNDAKAWGDDAQVVKLSASKFYSRAPSGVHIEIKPFDCEF